MPSTHPRPQIVETLATRDEKQSLLAALWFNFAGTVLMTWPWVIVGLGTSCGVESDTLCEF